jgi:hypothetical protein
MVRSRLAAFLIAALAAAPSACAVLIADPDADADGIRLSFEDVLAPSAYRREAPGRPAPPGAAAGFWAVVPDLPRPERARVENMTTGAATVVSLYGGGGATILVSRAAAEAIGLGPDGAQVRATALRRKPRIGAP